MTDMSTFARDEILSYFFKDTAMTARSATLYLAFYSSDPGRTGTSGTDVTTSVRSAGRLAIASSSWGAVTAVGNARQISNSATLSLGNAASSISVTHGGIWTASSGGNFITKVSMPFTTVSGQPYSIAIDALIIQLP